MLAVDCSVQSDGRTSLHCASEKGHVECVRLLLDRGAGVDVVSVSSWSDVHTHHVTWALRGARRALVDVRVCELGFVTFPGCVLEDVAVAGRFREHA
jgi:hypothetical protein